MSRRHVAVSGVVQGVGFRWFVREQARALGIAGRVKNLDDGSVEVEAEGDDAAMAAFVDRLREGPRGARVERMTELAAGNAGDILPNPFAIER